MVIFRGEVESHALFKQVAGSNPAGNMFFGYWILLFFFLQNKKNYDHYKTFSIIVNSLRFIEKSIGKR